MTLLMEAPPATVIAEPLPRPRPEPSDSWARVAIRAHGLLTQTLPDDELDALLAAPVRRGWPFVLPPFLFG